MKLVRTGPSSKSPILKEPLLQGELLSKSEAGLDLEITLAEELAGVGEGPETLLHHAFLGRSLERQSL